MSKKTIVSLITLGIVLIIVVISASSLIDSNKSGQFVVKQAAWSGDMSAITKEGVFGQFWGALIRYPRSETYYFSASEDEGKTLDESIPVTFKNGSTGKVSGSARYSYPIQSEDHLIAIHRRFRSDGGVRLDLVRTEIRKLINITASLLSPEAAMTQKGLFLQMFTDQVHNGQYQTEPSTERFEDPITKQITYRDVVKIRMNDKNQPMRMANPFEQWKITISQEVIQNIQTDAKTMQMIDKRRDAEMRVMVAKADVEKARQEEQKVVAEGKKAVAEKKYSALQQKELAVVNAEREKEVAEIDAQKKIEVAKRELEAAKLDAKKAEQEKIADIKRGTGKAEARKLVMSADGALSAKLATYENVMLKFAEAYKQRHVPSIVSGNTDAGSDNEFLKMTELFSYKVAKDLALDMRLDQQK